MSRSKISVIRPDDMLVLDFELVNLKVVSGRLKKQRSRGSAYLIVHFPPQHILEEAFYEKTENVVEEAFYDRGEGTTEEDDKKPEDWHRKETIPVDSEKLKIPASTRLSGSSRLVFKMPANETSFPYTEAGLLEACKRWELSTSPGPSPGNPPIKISRLSTAIELPYHLIISPDIPKMISWDYSRRPLRRIIKEIRSGLWDLPTKPAIHNGRTELWHMRLKTNITNTLRAIWATDQESAEIEDQEEGEEIEKLKEIKKHRNEPFRASLTSRDRWMLTEVMSDYNIFFINPVNRKKYYWVPKPAHLNQLMLSSLGGWLDAEGTWLKDRGKLDTRKVNGGTKPIELLGWKHQATMGRDHYVKVIYSGFLFPFGHAASLIKVTERKFEDIGREGERVAVLRQRFYIVVTEKTRVFEYRPEFPFAKVIIQTSVTPNLDEPGKNDSIDNDIFHASNQALFWPYVGEKAFKFDLVAIDLSGREIDFRAPLIFMSKEKGLPFHRMKCAVLGSIYVKDGHSHVPFHQQLIRFAKEKEDGDTDLITESIKFGTNDIGGDKTTDQLAAAGELAFLPIIDKAEVTSPSLQKILGSSQFGWFKYYDPYLTNEFKNNQGNELDNNIGEVFFESADTNIKVNFSNNADKSGGIITPNFEVSGISRSKGVFGGLVEDVYKGIFEPANAFPSNEPSQADSENNAAIDLEGAKFLGGLALSSILAEGSKDEMPTITYSQSDDAKIAKYSWHTRLFKRDDLEIFAPKDDTSLEVTNTRETSIGIEKLAKSITEATLKNFSLELFDVVRVNFDELTFTSINSSKPDITVDLTDTPVQFMGDLRFLDELRRFIPPSGFSDPPDLDVTSSYLKAGYTLGLPPIAVGAFSLENIKLGASFMLPFNGDPAVFRFNFCERHDTFVLTVLGLGGGGFLALALTTEGIKQIEGALEACARLTVNILGIAYGVAYVKIGIYFSWKVIKKEIEGEDKDKDVKVTDLVGYYELGGVLSVYGLVTVSVIFNLQLQYTYIAAAKQSTLKGQATVVVEIDLTFYSKSVELKVERTLYGSDADPLFIDLYTPTDWEIYCDSFAEEGAS